MIFKIFETTCEAGDVYVRVDVAEVDDVLVRGAPPTSVVVMPASRFHIHDGIYDGLVAFTLDGELADVKLYRAGTSGPRVDQGGDKAIVTACCDALMSVADEVEEFVRGATQEVLTRGIASLRAEETRLEAELADVRRRIAAASELTTHA